MTKFDLLQEPICHIHDYCIRKIEEVIEALDPEDNAGEIAELSEIIKALECAKEKGQSMEDRMIEYREAIEGLGFRRVKE